MFIDSPSDIAVAAVGVREEEFGERLDSDSFMACLEADEVAVQEANKMMLVSALNNDERTEVQNPWHSNTRTNCLCKPCLTGFISSTAI